MRSRFSGIRIVCIASSSQVLKDGDAAICKSKKEELCTISFGLNRAGMVFVEAVIGSGASSWGIGVDDSWGLEVSRGTAFVEFDEDK